MTDLDKLCGPISVEEAYEILQRFCHSHYDTPGEHARASIPADPKRDDDLRMSAFISQHAALLARAEKAEAALVEAETRLVNMLEGRNADMYAAKAFRRASEEELQGTIDTLRARLTAAEERERRVREAAEQCAEEAAVWGTTHDGDPADFAPAAAYRSIEERLRAALATDAPKEGT